MQSAGGLTIEQVLARSLRMPRRRLQHTPLGKRLDGNAAGGGATTSLDLDGIAASTDAPKPKRKSNFVVPGVRRESLSSKTWSKRGSMSAEDDGEVVADPDTTKAPGAALAGAIRRGGGNANGAAGGGADLFHLGLFTTGAGSKYPDPYPHRPTLKHMPKTNYVRTARDLSTHLNTCKRMGDWKDALATYFQASSHFLAESPTDATTPATGATSTVNLDGGASPASARRRAGGARDTPSVYYGHIFTLIDCLVDAGKGPLVEELVADKRLQVSPDVALLPHRPSPGSRRRKGGTGADLLSKGGLGSSVDPLATAAAADDLEDPSSHEAVQEAHADEEDVAVAEVDASTPLFPSSESEKAKKLEDTVLGEEDTPLRKSAPPTPIYSPFLLHLSFTYTRNGKWPEAIRLLNRLQVNALKKYETNANDGSVTSFKRLPRPPPVAAYNRILVHLEDLSASQNDTTVALPDVTDLSIEGSAPTATTVPGCAAWEVALQLMDRLKANYEPYIEECKKYDRKAYCARYGLNEDTAVVGLDAIESDIAARKEKKKLERAALRAKAREASTTIAAGAAANTNTASSGFIDDVAAAQAEEIESAKADDAAADAKAEGSSTDSVLAPTAGSEVVLTESEIRDAIGLPPVPAGTLPNGTTYALVMQILEHANQHDLADKLLLTMPEAERESIMASYSALIYLWSETKRRSPQFFGRNKR